MVIMRYPNVEWRMKPFLYELHMTRLMVVVNTSAMRRLEENGVNKSSLPGRHIVSTLLWLSVGRSLLQHGGGCSTRRLKECNPSEKKSSCLLRSRMQHNFKKSQFQENPDACRCITTHSMLFQFIYH